MRLHLFADEFRQLAAMMIDDLADVLATQLLDPEEETECSGTER